MSSWRKPFPSTQSLVKCILEFIEGSRPYMSQHRLECRLDKLTNQNKTSNWKESQNEMNKNTHKMNYAMGKKSSGPNKALMSLLFEERCITCSNLSSSCFRFADLTPSSKYKTSPSYLIKPKSDQLRKSTTLKILQTMQKHVQQKA